MVPASVGGKPKLHHRSVLGTLAAIRRTLRLAANRRHSSIVLTCGSVVGYSGLDVTSVTYAAI